MAGTHELRFFFISLREHLETMDRAREHLTEVPDAMRQRAALVEHPFGTIKDRHGYGGLLCRGLSLAGTEMGLSAWADNFTRVINLVGTQGLLGAIRVRRMAAQGYEMTGRPWPWRPPIPLQNCDGRPKSRGSIIRSRSEKNHPKKPIKSDKGEFLVR